MTFTQLRVGTKSFKSKPPRLGAPCTDQRVTSFMSLDSHVAANGRGPNGDELADALNLDGAGSGFRDHSIFSDDSKLFYPAFANDRGWPDSKIVDTDPPSGATYHVYRPTTEPSAIIFLITAVACGPIADPPGSGAYLPYTSIVDPGALVTVTVDAKSNVLTGTPQLSMSHEFYELDGTLISVLQDFPALTTGYVTYQYQVAAPTSSYFWFTNVGWFGASSTPDWSAGNFEIAIV